MISILILIAMLSATPADAAADGDRSRPAKPFQTTPLKMLSSDYPRTALLAGQSGITHFRLEIDVEGRATGCIIIGSSGWPELDAKTCRLLMGRGRFIPARDATGKLIPGTYASSFKWLPGAPVRSPRGSWSRVSQFESDAEGDLVACTMQDHGAIATGFFAVCEIPFATAKEQARGAGRLLASRRFIRRIAQSVGGSPADSFMPPAGAVEVESASMHYMVSASGAVRDCVLRHSFRSLLQAPTKCDANPYVALPAGSPDMPIDWTLTTWELPAASGPKAPNNR